MYYITITQYVQIINNLKSTTCGKMTHKINLKLSQDHYRSTREKTEKFIKILKFCNFERMLFPGVTGKILVASATNERMYM